MNIHPIVLRAAAAAQQMHAGQKEDTGRPYIIHPEQVYNILLQITSDHVLLAAAWLHDVIEDTECTYDDLVKEFGEEIADLVNEVTHEGKKDSLGFYFPRLKTERGVLLKFADRLSNLSRMENWDEKRRAHYLKRSKFWKSQSDHEIEQENLHFIKSVMPKRHEK